MKSALLNSIKYANKKRVDKQGKIQLKLGENTCEIHCAKSPLSGTGKLVLTEVC